jgi:hypothetical protein
MIHGIREFLTLHIDPVQPILDPMLASDGRTEASEPANHARDRVALAIEDDSDRMLAGAEIRAARMDGGDPR